MQGSLELDDTTQYDGDALNDCFECKTVADMVADIADRTRWNDTEVYSGIWYTITEPKCIMLVQRERAPKAKCAHCGGRHPRLIVQRISVKPERAGLGSRVMRELTAALERLEVPSGFYLQCTITPGSKALARSLRMTRHPDTGDCWDMCAMARR
jgi:hypothetical protein